MITKFDIGESVCLYDFDNEKVVFGTIMGIQAFASKQHRTDLGKTLISEVEVNYDIDCVDYKYERKEKHLFKTVHECKSYYLNHIK